jgi:uncharacterized protein YecT (DUF1311 family)
LKRNARKLYGCDKPSFFTGLFFILISASAHAADRFELCQAKAAGVTVPLRACISNEAARQNIILNARYKKAMATLEAPLKSKLKNAQRRWITQRDEDCSLVGEAEGGGTLAAVLTDRCALDMTRTRVDFLTNLIAVSGN